MLVLDLALEIGDPGFEICTVIRFPGQHLFLLFIWFRAWENSNWDVSHYTYDERFLPWGVLVCELVCGSDLVVFLMTL